MSSHGNFCDDEKKRDDIIKANQENIKNLDQMATENCKNIKAIQESIGELSDSNKLLTEAVLRVQTKIIEVDKHQRNGLKDEIVSKLLESMDKIMNGQSSTIQGALNSTYKNNSDGMRFRTLANNSVQETIRTKWTTVGKVIRDIVAPGAIIWLIIDKILA